MAEIANQLLNTIGEQARGVNHGSHWQHQHSSLKRQAFI
ncbi:MAG: hypothetical protein Rpha_1825 [Candidatus Ruthia sp. Apha_13_S6]|nr:hypothetical protein [Candidatus Ruthia sp. Apha_13_S6]